MTCQGGPVASQSADAEDVAIHAKEWFLNKQKMDLKHLNVQSVSIIHKETISNSNKNQIQLASVNGKVAKLPNASNVKNDGNYNTN